MFGGHVAAWAEEWTELVISRHKHTACPNLICIFWELCIFLFLGWGGRVLAGVQIGCLC